MHTTRHLILLNILLILHLQVVIGNLHALPDLVNIHEPIAHDAPLRHLIFALVLLVE